MLMLLLLLPQLATSCTTAGDCSWNGECSASVMRVPQRLEGRVVRDAERRAWPAWSRPSIAIWTGSVSSWGGSVMRDDDGMYHMLVSEMATHAGADPGRATRALHTPRRPVPLRPSSANGPCSTSSRTSRCAPPPGREWVCLFAHNPAYPSPPCNGTNGTTHGSGCRCDQSGPRVRTCLCSRARSCFWQLEQAHPRGGRWRAGLCSGVGRRHFAPDSGQRPAGAGLPRHARRHRQ